MNNPDMEIPLSMSGKFIKVSDFDGNGLKLKIASDKAVMVVCSNPKYGFPDGPNKGKTIRYAFEDLEGKERIFDSKSLRFASGISKFKKGDIVTIVRHPAGTDTQYEVKKEDDLASIPF